MGEDYLGDIEYIIDEIRNEEMDADYGIKEIYKIAKKMNDRIKQLEEEQVDENIPL